MSAFSILNIFGEKMTGTGIFIEKKDTLNNPGIHLRLLHLAVFLMISYGCAGDAQDEYLQMSDKSIFLLITEFCKFSSKTLEKSRYIKRKRRI